MNPYLHFVQQIETQVQAAGALPRGGMESYPQPGISPDAPKVLLFSPHPDDECITGTLPLRLMREAGARIINVPVTFGSNLSRQPERAEELKNACAFLGWEIFQKLETRPAGSPQKFQPLGKTDIADLLRRISPAAIFVPHFKDWNSRHVSTHVTVMTALEMMDPSFSCAVIETEYWGAMEKPNLMVEADAQTVADLVAALSFHVKEVERNPYHLTLAAWMQDNVRRGGELVGGQGGAAPDFSFATLYRLRRWENGKLFQISEKGRLLAMDDDLKELF